MTTQVWASYKWKETRHAKNVSFLIASSNTVQSNPSWKNHHSFRTHKTIDRYKQVLAKKKIYKRHEEKPPCPDRRLYSFHHKFLRATGIRIWDKPRTTWHPSIDHVSVYPVMLSFVGPGEEAELSPILLGLRWLWLCSFLGSIFSHVLDGSLSSL